MTVLQALHVRLEALTASFRHPLVISGIQVSTPMPAYSNLLGMISACAGRVVGPRDTRVGFEFHCSSHDLELEKTVRWQMDQKGRLKPHSKGQGINFRQVYWAPRLDVYLTNLGLRSAFERPAATPCFGRSQDIAWITSTSEVELHPVARGLIGPTLLPYPQPGVAGIMVRLPEYFDNTRAACVRRPGPFGYYHAMVSTIEDFRIDIERGHLFHPSDASSKEDVVYLHEWLEE